MRTISFINQKGGVGKSSCVMHLAGILASRGYNTLLVDGDQQASITQGFLTSSVGLGLDPRRTIAGLYEQDCASSLRDMILDIGRPRLALVPGSYRLQNFNVPNPWNTGPDQFILRDSLAEVNDEFDLCLIDCPPHVQLSGWSALVAADGAVVPAQLEDFGIQGVSAILDWIDQARMSATPGLKLLGLLATMFDPKGVKVHRDYEQDLRAAYGDDVFQNFIPYSNDYKTAVTKRETIIEYRPKSKASKAAEAVADELIARLDARCPLVVSETPVVELSIPGEPERLERIGA